MDTRKNKTRSYKNDRKFNEFKRRKNFRRRLVNNLV